MTIQEIAERMRPEYDSAADEDGKRDVLKRWNELLVDAEPNPPAVPRDELREAIDSAFASWERVHGRVRRRA